MSRRIFVSSVQKEFKDERAAVQAYVRSNPLLSRFFEVVLFEDLPARDRRADKVYLAEVDSSEILLALFGAEYGPPTKPKGLSPTEQEFDRATARRKTRLVFIKGDAALRRDPRMAALIAKADAQLIRRRFQSIEELVAGVYAALVEYLDEHELIRTVPFDAAPARGAKLADLDEKRIGAFVALARKERSFPLSRSATTKEVLQHLNLLANGRPNHAAVLLFGTHPQRFVQPSEVKCAHFHGTTETKPIPSYQVYKGRVFDLVDQAVDFVMSKINLAVGTRAQSTAVPIEYEIPQEVVREAIVNAVAHRDYTSNGSVQVMLFADRLEVWNPGALPPSLTLAMLSKPHGSVPRNPLIAEPLYLAKYIERMGTGTREMISRCKAAGLPAPVFSVSDGFKVMIRRRPGRALEAVSPGKKPGGTPQVPRKYPASTPQVVAVLAAASVAERSREELQAAAKLADREHFRLDYLEPLLQAGLLERTIPDKPRSSRQRYRITAEGREYLTQAKKRGSR
jgi:ATP-dependent DNA helicase RecG